MLNGKTILVTGGTGSFGQAFAKIALRDYNVKKLIVFSRNELMQYRMQQKFCDDRLRFFVGDVRDKDRLYRVLEGVDICIHAAALKQIPVVEYNPIEAVEINIDGAINIVNACLDNAVSRVIGISSDKAVAPCNLYGATKMVMEKLLVQANAYTGNRSIRFACTRYGNVAGSHASVIPLFLKQRESGEVTITDERMTRFWLTLEQGVRFVIDCLNRMKGGEIFIPKIPSMRIVDVADAIAPNARKTIVGIRAGEKLYETLFTEDESRHALEFENYYVVTPEFPFWTEQRQLDGGKVAVHRVYTSDNNTWWLTREELQDMIEGLDDD